MVDIVYANIEFDRKEVLVVADPPIHIGWMTSNDRHWIFVLFGKTVKRGSNSELKLFLEQFFRNLSIDDVKQKFG